MWKCEKCGEECENDSFDTCWSCGARKGGMQLSPAEMELSVLKKILDRQNDQIDLMEKQLRLLKGIRWAIVGFTIWFTIQFWILPMLLASSR